jgi:hypothetical protein
MAQIPTTLAAAVALKPATSVAVAAAWEISAMPAVVFRARMAVSRYH